MNISSATREPLAPWIRRHRDEIDQALWTDGYVLFRDFAVDGLAGFEQAASAACDQLYKDYGDLPLSSAGDHVYFATPYPKHLPIQFHNEASHTPSWPSRQLFYCLAPAAQGGEWALSDGRQVLEQLPAAMAERFRELGLLYRRRFIRGLDTSWEQFFQVASLQQLRDKVVPSGQQVEASSADDVCVSYRTRAVLELPERGTAAWFNQVLLHHPAALAPEVAALLGKHFSPERFPRTVLFGDGSPIPGDWITALEALLNRSALRIQTHAGDVLLVNNLLMAHGRLPYSGNRQVRVALGDMRSHGCGALASRGQGSNTHSRRQWG
ncbi:MAG: TauD/TfdA family dioxygenase [Pseudomonas sp.]|uniref:TauD/TfdA family dioxygenase n=1 Tax=Pseudomonas sp. TaxID=306 RepID=UPI0033917CE9